MIYPWIIQNSPLPFILFKYCACKCDHCYPHILHIYSRFLLFGCYMPLTFQSPFLGLLIIPPVIEIFHSPLLFEAYIWFKKIKPHRAKPFPLHLVLIFTPPPYLIGRSWCYVFVSTRWVDFSSMFTTVPFTISFSFLFLYSVSLCCVEFQDASPQRLWASAFPQGKYLQHLFAD